MAERVDGGALDLRGFPAIRERAHEGGCLAFRQLLEQGNRGQPFGRRSAAVREHGSGGRHQSPDTAEQRRQLAGRGGQKFVHTLGQARDRLPAQAFGEAAKGRELPPGTAGAGGRGVEGFEQRSQPSGISLRRQDGGKPGDEFDATARAFGGKRAILGERRQHRRPESVAGELNTARRNQASSPSRCTARTSSASVAASAKPPATSSAAKRRRASACSVSARTRCRNGSFWTRKEGVSQRANSATRGSASASATCRCAAVSFPSPSIVPSACRRAGAKERERSSASSAGSAATSPDSTSSRCAVVPVPAVAMFEQRNAARGHRPESG